MINRNVELAGDTCVEYVHCIRIAALPSEEYRRQHGELSGGYAEQEGEVTWLALTLCDSCAVSCLGCLTWRPEPKLADIVHDVPSSLGLQKTAIVVGLYLRPLFDGGGDGDLESLYGRRLLGAGDGDLGPRLLRTGLSERSAERDSERESDRERLKLLPLFAPPDLLGGVTLRERPRGARPGTARTGVTLGERPRI
ncbi:hypothetical protein O988_06125 [Pseudogymnoascus sp. VKM F-3808]|nr:hypothetical protein O988_06125 [Pseudogymnoascus sp. VKM F-3808]